MNIKKTRTIIIGVSIFFMLIIAGELILLFQKNESPATSARKAAELNRQMAYSEYDQLYTSLSTVFNQSYSSEEDKQHKQHEYDLMKTRLPGNMWIPGDFSAEKTRILHQFVDRRRQMELKVWNGSASPAEAESFYTELLKDINDRIDVINYYHQRTRETRPSNGHPLVSIESLRSLDQYKKSLEDEAERIMQVKDDYSEGIQ